MAQTRQLTREEILNNDYDPYQNRDRPHATNRLDSLINMVKGVLGTGLLALPEAFLNSGLLLGTVGTVVISLVVIYCLHLLFQGMFFICKKDKIPQILFPHAMKEGFKVGPNCLRGIADNVPYLVNFFIILYQFGIMCIYVVFIASNVKQVIDEYVDKKYQYSVEIYMIFSIIPLLLMCYVKNLKMLAPFSNIANWITLIGLCMLMYFVFESIPPLSERNLIAKFQSIPLFIGTTLFSLISIGSLLSIESNLKYPEFWTLSYGTLNTGMFIILILNIITGFFGYWKYGDETEASITLNIDIKHPVAQAVRILFALAIYFSFALQAYPATEIIWEQYVQDYMTTSQHLIFWEYVLRTVGVMLSFVLAVAIPYLGLFISLFGAFCLSVLVLIFPPLLDICLRWPNEFGPKNIIWIRDIALIIFGIVGFAIGTYSAMYAIVLTFTNKDTKIYF